MPARVNKSEHRLTKNEVSEHTVRRELFEALVTECDCNELLAETIAVLAEDMYLLRTLDYARRGKLSHVVGEFQIWTALERKLNSDCMRHEELFGWVLNEDLLIMGR